jgi:hypothetical protein
MTRIYRQDLAVNRLGLGKLPGLMELLCHSEALVGVARRGPRRSESYGRVTRRPTTFGRRTPLLSVHGISSKNATARLTFLRPREAKRARYGLPAARPRSGSPGANLG